MAVAPRLAAQIIVAIGALACGPRREERASDSPPESVAPAPEAAAASAVVGRPPAPRARVIVGGDLIPHRPALVAPASIRAALAPLAETFATADVAVANYEAATGEIDPQRFRLAHAAPPGWMDELRRSGIGAVTVANNHACDLGIAGLQATLAAAEASGVEAVGGDRHDGWTPRVVVDQPGRRVCAVAWTTLMNAQTGCAKTLRLASASLDREGHVRISAAISKARARCDATIAILHGGDEYTSQTKEVLEQARQAAEAGADAVVVHHPHVASPLVVHETREGRRVPLFASVGNLVSNQGESWSIAMPAVSHESRRLVCVNGWTRLGVLADLTFEFDRETVRVDFGYHLTWTENEHAVDRSAPLPRIVTRLLDPDADHAIIARLSTDERGPTELFRDPCWVELGTTEPRCTTTSRRPSSGGSSAALARSARGRTR